MNPQQRALFAALEATLQSFVQFVLAHRPATLQGMALGQALSLDDRKTTSLLSLWNSWRARPRALLSAPPALAFAVLGNARAMGLLGANEELSRIGTLLDQWALRRQLSRSNFVSTPA
jgi:hypothetical protein